MRLAHRVWTGGAVPGESAARAELVREGYAVYRWSDAPGARYEPHAHDDDECLWVLAGGITFEVGGASYTLRAGDRLELPAGTVHAATAGPGGATYLVGERVHP
ncbi:MAG TPA: cupin domain-containing protein [Candidatus Limnocylindria bacterium]|nr:cupin domain-containing protein [Candidatus Limnocylindria bacterium]